jgi:hypothetical protein
VAFKISKTEEKQFADLTAKFEAQIETVRTAVEAYNETMSEARGKVDDELAVLNELRDNVRGFFEDIHSERQGEFEDKSEKWQEGDRGEATRSWLDRLEEIASNVEEEIEMDTVDDLTFDPTGLPIVELIEEGLPIEPEY